MNINTINNFSASSTNHYTGFNNKFNALVNNDLNLAEKLDKISIQIKENRDPRASDVLHYDIDVMSLWLNTLSRTVFICLDIKDDEAVWVPFAHATLEVDLPIFVVLTGVAGQNRIKCIFKPEMCDRVIIKRKRTPWTFGDNERSGYYVTTFENNEIMKEDDWYYDENLQDEIHYYKAFPQIGEKYDIRIGYNEATCSPGNLIRECQFEDKYKLIDGFKFNTDPDNSRAKMALNNSYVVKGFMGNNIYFNNSNSYIYPYAISLSGYCTIAIVIKRTKDEDVRLFDYPYSSPPTNIETDIVNNKLGYEFNNHTVLLDNDDYYLVILKYNPSTKEVMVYLNSYENPTILNYDFHIAVFIYKYFGVKNSTSLLPTPIAYIREYSYDISNQDLKNLYDEFIMHKKFAEL